MTTTIEALQVRIHKLKQKDPVGNDKIIRKLQRKVRSMKNK